VKAHRKVHQFWLGFGGLLIALLLAGVFTLGSLDLPFQPKQWSQVVVLYALSTFIVAALLVFGLILTRTLLRLWAERRARQLGSGFKTRMVLGAMAISLLPVAFLFFASYALLNRTLARWFPRPLEIAAEESQKLINDLGRVHRARLADLAARATRPKSLLKDRGRATAGGHAILARAFKEGANAAWIVGPDNSVREAKIRPSRIAGAAEKQPATPPVFRLHLVRTLPSGVELWESSGAFFLAGRAALPDGALVVGQRVPEDFLRNYIEIESQMQTYNLQKQQYRAVKTQMLLALSLFTMLLLFSTTWFAVFLSKQVTVPIEALAEGTRAVSAGNLDYQVQVQAQDELGILVRSFNRMTAQLSDSHRQIDEFTRSLQQAVQELERRRKLLETILENIPTGVVSLDEAGSIVRLNPAAMKIFGENSRAARTLVALVGEEAAEGIWQLARRSLRMGVASKELEIALPGQLVHAAVTVSSLGPRRANPGFVVVVDDLTDLLRAKKAAAWQEVAQRIAHEIKNPLTPIQLSAERLGRYLRRHAEACAAPPADELVKLVSECAGLIQREAATLGSLVDEFSQFARFPMVRLVPADPNAILTSALEVFRGRLDGFSVHTSLAAHLPAVRADPELLRRVLVNLIDNAAEAMENSAAKELALSTRASTDGETVEIVIADTGQGISPEDKDKLFLPHFSTKDRGTGLGLAIASRVIAEHHGIIRAEDNLPTGARFVIQLPVAEVPAAPLPSHL
jgi:PAS domain S-box-containing protein